MDNPRHGTAIPEYWVQITYRQGEWTRPIWRTLDGRRLRILYPGEANHDNGPDFLNALIEVDGVRCRGDVECHVRPADWFRHGHHQDQRYRKVVLHVIWEAPSAVALRMLPRCLHVVLSRQLRFSVQQWFLQMQRLEQSELPQGLPSRLPSVQELASLAWQRLEAKMTRLNTWLGQRGFGETLFIVLAESLGYSKNQFPFRQLLWEVPVARLRQHLNTPGLSLWRYWLYLAQRADLLPPPARLEQELSPEERHWLRGLRHQGHLPVLRKSDWHFSRLRPVNQPVLRLAQLANWLYLHPGDQLFQQLLEAAMQRLPFTELMAKWRACLCRPVPQPINHRICRLYRWRSPGRPFALGEQRFRQAVLNGLIPLLILWARQSGSLGFQAYLETLYEQFPSCESAGVLSRLLHRAESPSPIRRLQRSGFLQQGLYQWLGLQSRRISPTGLELP